MIRPFGPRHAQFIRRQPAHDARINLLEGSIRSAKTMAVNAKLTRLLLDKWWPGGTGLITGASKTSVKTNLLNDLFATIGEKRYQYNSQSGEMTLFGRPFRVASANDEASWKYIAGSTVGLWIGDEAGNYPQSFFDMASSRMSMPGSRAYLTANPGNPHHYLKKDYIDNPKVKQTGQFWSGHYTLEDNPNVLEVVKEGWRTQYTGVFYLRNILGLWVIADGAIYRDVFTPDLIYTDETRPIDLLSQNGHRERFILCDYGTVNPMVFLDEYDDGRTMWIENEYYWDSKQQMRQKTDSQYADDLIEFIGPCDSFRRPGVILDPSAASFRVELQQRGFFVIDANNEVIEGIRKVSSMMNHKRIRIHERCRHTRREHEAYAWDTKAALRGEEQPIKSNDHTPDALRYGVHTRIGDWDWRLAAAA